MFHTGLAIAAWHEISAYWWRVLWISSVFFLFELLWPAHRYTLASRLRGARFWVVYIIITGTFFGAFNKFWGSLGVHPLLTLQLSGFLQSPYAAVRYASWIVVPIIGIQVGEFFYYWFHRAQHRFAPLWRFHAVHHSLREMSAFNSNHHWTEEIFRIPFIVVPMTFLVQVNEVGVPLIVAAILGMQGQFEHSATRFNLGLLRYIIPDNRYHRLHHSIQPEHIEHNFGSGSALWDIVFRIAIFPKRRDEWPEVGLAEIDEPKTFGDFLFRPFRRRQPTAGAPVPLAGVGD